MPYCRSAARHYPSLTPSDILVVLIIPREPDSSLLLLIQLPDNPTPACLAQRTAIMACAPAVESDPFADPDIVGEPQETGRESTLTVGRNASLTLATESMIVLGRPSPSPSCASRQVDTTQMKGLHRGRRALVLVRCRAVSLVRNSAYDSTDTSQKRRRLELSPSSIYSGLTFPNLILPFAMLTRPRRTSSVSRLFTII